MLQHVDVVGANSGSSSDVEDEHEKAASMPPDVPVVAGTSQPVGRPIALRLLTVPLTVMMTGTTAAARLALKLRRLQGQVCRMPKA